MMKYYLDDILNEMMKDESISSLEGVVKNSNRKIYFNSGEYQENSIDLVFLVDTGTWFKETIAFTIKTNSFSREIEVIKHTSFYSVTFNRRPAKNVSDYIVDEIIKFKNKDKKYLKVSNS